MSVIYWILSFALAITSVTFHVKALHVVTPLLDRMHGDRFAFLHVVAATSAIVLMHFAEMLLFGVLYMAVSEFSTAGHIHGADHIRDYFYFSAASYTSLGYGDLYPTGPLRLFAGVEALIGLTLIGWTVAFTFPYVAKKRRKHGHHS